MKRGKQLAAALASLLFCAGLGSKVLAAQTKTNSPIVIVEVQTGSSASASQEFIELANVSDADVDVSNWRVEYFSAAPKSFDTPTRVMPLHGSLPADKHYLLASTNYLVGSANDSFSAGLAATGGHLRLVSTDPNTPTAPVVHDMLGWGTATLPEGQAASAPKAGESLQRKLDATDKPIDTNDNKNDFTIGSPSPEGFVPAPDAPDPETDSTTTNTNTETGTDTTSAQTGDTETTPPEKTTTDMIELPAIPLQITELLPNPAAPQTDADDEYIELYNPNDSVVELTGYKLQTGTTYSHSFEFNDQTIAAHEYKALKVTETSVVLANTAGKARLIAPNGQVMSETADYTNAPDGQAWAWTGSDWQWSTTATPGAANNITTKEDAKAAPKAPAAAKTSAAKKTTTSTAKPKAKTTAAKAVKGASTNGSGAGATQDVASADSAKPSVIHPAILAGVGGLALLYGLYEYRHDLANAVQRFRSNRTNRRAARAKA